METRRDVLGPKSYRLKWLTFADKNSIFFHATTVQRRDRNKLYRLKDMNGVWVEGHCNVMAAIEEYYRSIYVTAVGSNNDECLHVIPNLVTLEMNQVLMEPVGVSEVEKAVFSLGALKALGPDGFNGQFFQKNWEFLKEDVVAIVRDFFRTGSMGDSVSDIIVALTPKVPHLEEISQLRPISCCNFLYKIISKIMVARLKPLLYLLISPQQSAFVGGRLIQDNLVVAQEAFHFLKKKNVGAS